MDLNTSGQNVTATSVLMPGLLDLQKAMFSDSYRLTASTLTRVCPSMTSLMLWITSFNRRRPSFLLLLLSAFLKVRAMNFNVNSSISSAFQCSVCSAAKPPTCISSTVNFLAAESPFSNEVNPSRVVCRNCQFLGCIGAFSQFLKCFSKLLIRLMVLLQWGHCPILI